MNLFWLSNWKGMALFCYGLITVSGHQSHQNERYKGHLHVRNWWSHVFQQHGLLPPDLQVCAQPMCWCICSDKTLAQYRTPASAAQPQLQTPTAWACSLRGESAGRKPWVPAVQHSDRAQHLSNGSGLLTVHAGAQWDKEGESQLTWKNAKGERTFVFKANRTQRATKVQMIAVLQFL